MKARILPLKSPLYIFHEQQATSLFGFGQIILWNIGLAKVGLIRMEQKLFFGVI
jgi:hypothetical protein